MINNFFFLFFLFLRAFILSSPPESSTASIDNGAQTQSKKKEGKCLLFCARDANATNGACKFYCLTRFTFVVREWHFTRRVSIKMWRAQARKALPKTRECQTSMWICWGSSGGGRTGLNMGRNGYAIIARVDAIHLLNMFEMAFWFFVAFAAQFIIFAQLIRLAGFAFYYHFMFACVRSALTCSHRRVAEKTNRTYSRNGTM